MILYTWTVPDTLAPTRLYAFVRRMLPQEPEYRVREAFERRDVKLNGARATRDALALPGAEVRVYLPEGKRALAPEIVYEDDRLLVVSKPVGVSCEPDDKGGLTLPEWLGAAYPGRWTQALKPCHRLDNQTDGLLLLAKDCDALEAMQMAFRDRSVHKRYTCLVKGAPKPAEGTLEAYLRKDARAARVTVLDHPAPGALPIRTGYQTLEGGEISRLKIDLYTGRTHQIRAQMAHIGHPLLGDDRYGDRALNRERGAKRLMLTATEMSFTLSGPYQYLNDIRLSVQPGF